MAQRTGSRNCVALCGSAQRFYRAGAALQCKRMPQTSTRARIQGRQGRKCVPDVFLSLCGCCLCATAVRQQQHTPPGATRPSRRMTECIATGSVHLAQAFRLRQRVAAFLYPSCRCFPLALVLARASLARTAQQALRSPRVFVM